MANRGIFYDEGTYYCEILDQSIGTSNGGTPGVTFKIKVLGLVDASGGFTALDRQYERYVNLWITAKTVDRVVADLRQLGYQGFDYEDFDKEAPNFYDAIGKTVDCACRHGEYEGKEKEEWQIARARSMQSKKLAGPQARQIKDLFGRAARAQAPLPANLQKAAQKTSAKAAGKPAVAEYENADEITDDDIPF